MKRFLIASVMVLSFNTFALQQDLEKKRVEDVDQLNVNIDGYDPALTIMQYNVNNAVGAEKVEKTKWKYRHQRVVKLVAEANADIVSINELRELSNTISVK